MDSIVVEDAFFPKESRGRKKNDTYLQPDMRLYVERKKKCHKLPVTTLRLLIPSIRIVSRKPVITLQNNPGRDNAIRPPEPLTRRNTIKGINKYLLRKGYGKILQFAHFGFPYQRYATAFKRFLLRAQMYSEVKQCIWQQFNRSFIEIIPRNDLAAIASPAI